MRDEGNLPLRYFATSALRQETKTRPPHNCFLVSQNSWGNAPGMDRRIVLLALLLPALLVPSCSKFAGNLPKPDIVVSADGSGDFKTIQAAIASIPAINRERVVVFVQNRTYREKIRVDASFVTLRGQSRKRTRIEFPQLKDDFAAHPDDLGAAIINQIGR